MLEAALRSGAADRRCVFEAFARRLPEGRRYGVVAGTGRFLEALQEFRFGGRGDRGPAPTQGRRRGDLRLAGRLPLLRRRQRVCGGRGLLPRLTGARGRVVVRRGRRPRDARAVDPQPRHRDRVRRLADDRRGRRPAVHRDGLPANARGGRRRGRARRIHRGLRDDEQPRGGPSLRGTHGRHRGARLHPRARLGARGLRGPGGQPRARDHPARRHLRRPGRRSHRGRGGRDVARRGPARLGRPAGAGAAGSRPARLARGHRHADHRHVRPRRVCDRLARVRAGRRLRGGDPAGDRVRVHRPRAWSTSSSRDPTTAG